MEKFIRDGAMPVGMTAATSTEKTVCRGTLSNAGFAALVSAPLSKGPGFCPERSTTARHTAAAVR
jgi:hypothetical protein